MAAAHHVLSMAAARPQRRQRRGRGDSFAGGRTAARVAVAVAVVVAAVCRRHVDTESTRTRLLALPAADARQSRGREYAPETQEEYDALLSFNAGAQAERDGRELDALQAYEHATRLMPHLKEAHLNIGSLLTRVGATPDDTARAQRHLETLVRLAEADSDSDMLGGALNNLGLLQFASAGVDPGSLRECAATFQRSLELEVSEGGTGIAPLYNLGKMLDHMGLLDEALEHYQRVLSIDAAHSGALNNVGNLALKQGNCALAAEYYAAGVRVIEEEATHSPPGDSLGNDARFAANDDDGDDDSRNAVLLRQNLAQAYRLCGMLEEAAAVLAAIATQTTGAAAQSQGGSVKQASEAERLRTQGLLMSVRRTMWDWSTYETEVAAAVWGLRHLAEAAPGAEVRVADPDVSAGASASETLGLSVYETVLLPVPPRVIHAVASRVAAAFTVSDAALARYHAAVSRDFPRDVSGRLHSDWRLHVGYLSYDFRDHVMGYMTFGLMVHHDRSRVRVTCYYYGPTPAGGSTLSPFSERVASVCDAFASLGSAQDDVIAQRIRDDRVHVLVDLMAHTTGGRALITALKPAPVIVNFLGFPGTTGAEATDYIVVDRAVLGGEERGAVSEARVLLPHTYQANNYEPGVPTCAGGPAATDVGRPPCMTRGRADLGVAADEDRVVLANLNSAGKLEPGVFCVWMRVLARVPNAVLWILAPAAAKGELSAPGASSTERARGRLRAEAAARGVDPSRIVFAEHTSRLDNLERYRMVDLFVDSHVYNAHSTAGDALWGQAPVLTCGGATFQSRVAGSLLEAVGLPVLRVHSLRDFEDTAVRLARAPHVLRRMRTHLAAVALRAAAFDTARITRSLERAYAAMWEQQYALPPVAASVIRRDAGRLSSKWHVVVNPRARAAPVVGLGVLNGTRNGFGTDDHATLDAALLARANAVVRDGREFLESGNAAAAAAAGDRVIHADLAGGGSDHKARAVAITDAAAHVKQQACEVDPTSVSC